MFKIHRVQSVYADSNSHDFVVVAALFQYAVIVDVISSHATHWKLIRNALKKFPPSYKCVFACFMLELCLCSICKLYSQFHIHYYTTLLWGGPISTTSLRENPSSLSTICVLWKHIASYNKNGLYSIERHCGLDYSCLCLLALMINRDWLLQYFDVKILQMLRCSLLTVHILNRKLCGTLVSTLKINQRALWKTDIIKRTFGLSLKCSYN